MWWFRYYCIVYENASGGRPDSAGLEALGKRLRLPQKAVLLMRTRARLDKQVLSFEEPGSPFVALLPHVRAARLTVCASYW
jgi:hypothetical protein